MPWHPGDPWPSSTPGGAISPHWGGYTKLWVLAAIGSGNTFHMGAHAYDRLDAGNVMGGGSTVPAPPSGTLWLDMACDIVAATITAGASSSDGLFSKPSAATLTVTIADPDGDYDPLNPNSPYAYGGRSRLVPGTPITAFAEVVDPATSVVTRYTLFTGTADSWGQDWTAQKFSRRTVMVASDSTKLLARLDRAEQAPVGTGDTTAQRVHRILDFFGWLGPVVDDPAGGTVTLQSTTLAQTAWEMLNRTLDDELGYIHLTADNKLRWLNRNTWATKPAPAVTLGCEVGHDIMVDASPTSLDRQMRNSVYAARAGGTTQTAKSQSSIDRYGAYEYTRTDLGLADDGQVAVWGSKVLELYAYPQVGLADITMRADASPEPWKAWADLLKINYVTDLVRIVWPPPGSDYTIDTTARVVGVQHEITRTRWQVKWQLIATNPLQSAGVTFHMGAHANDRLDSNFVLAA